MAQRIKISLAWKGLLAFSLMISFLLALMQCSKESTQTAEEKRSELIQPSKWWKKLPRPVYGSLEKVNTSQPWFEVYRLTEDTFAIYEPFQFEEAISYLVSGEERAVVIDTGTGIGNLKQVISELTGLSVSVVNTHTHWDHIGNNHQFTEIACYDDEECIRKMRQGVSNERLRSSVTGDSIWKPLPEGFDTSTWAILPVEPTSLLEDGDMIELGGRSLEVIHTPGHSPGSICLLDRKSRILFTGDTFFPGPLYAYPEDVNIDDYMDSLEKLNSRLDEYGYFVPDTMTPGSKAKSSPAFSRHSRISWPGKANTKKTGTSGAIPLTGSTS